MLDIENVDTLKTINKLADGLELTESGEEWRKVGSGMAQHP